MAKKDRPEMLATRKVYGEVLKQLGEQNPDIFVLDADLSGSTQTKIFAQAFPERFYNVGIAEQNLIGTAAGLASAGKIPFVSTFAVFATGRAWEPIRQSLCVPKWPVKIVATHGGVTVGPDGGSHQMTEDFAIMRVLPNMAVFCPADGYQTASIMKSIINYQDGPCYVRLSRVSFPVIYGEDAPFEIGKADMLRDGEDLTIIAVGIMVHKALKAAELLEKEGVSVRVLNMSSLKPIDKQTIIKAAEETGAVLTAEEHQITGGLGSVVCQVLAENRPVPVKVIGVPDRFGLSGNPDELLEKQGLGVDNVVTAARELLKRK